MHPPKQLTVATPAKVNLALSVGAPETPGGLHPIASWMVALDFADELSLAVPTDGVTRIDVAMADGAPVPWPVESDLTCRAHQLLQEHTGRGLALDLRLRKRIPAGAGLGGGSGNAAYTLVGVNRLYGLGLSEDDLIMLAARLGSDVPFFVAAALGAPSALVTGTGADVEAVRLAGPVHVVLCFPDAACPTGEVYAAFDRLTADRDPRPLADAQRVRELATGSWVRDERAGGVASLPVFNDLADAAMRVRPSLRRVAEEIGRAIGAAVHVSGSGSTLFLIGVSRDDCEQLVRVIRERTGIAAVPARSLPSGAGAGSTTAH